MASAGEIDHYAVLEISVSATAEEIRGAYKRLALLRHPDKNPQNARAHERFIQVLCAFEVLGDPVKRADYDRSRSRLAFSPSTSQSSSNSAGDQEARRKQEEADRQRRQQENTRKRQEKADRQRRQQEQNKRKQEEADRQKQQQEEVDRERRRQETAARKQREADRERQQHQEALKKREQEFAENKAGWLSLLNQGPNPELDRYEEQEGARARRQRDWDLLDLKTWNENWRLETSLECELAIAKYQKRKADNLRILEADNLSALLTTRRSMLAYWEKSWSIFAARAAKIESLKKWSKVLERRSLSSALLRAVAEEDYPRIESLLDCGADLNTSPALFNAVLRKNINMVTYLLGEGALQLPRRSDGCRPLHIAASYEESRLAQLLISASPTNVNDVNNDSNTPLLEASRSGYSDTIHLLLSAGADPTITNRFGQTVLHLQCWSFERGWGKYVSFSSLLEHGICRGASPNVRDKNGKLAADYVQSSYDRPNCMTTPWPKF